MAERAKRYNQGKAQLHWIDAWPHALQELTKPFEFGAAKYGPYNYKKGAPFSESYDCARRHMMKWFNGQEYDEETFEKTGEKVSHLAFAAWNILRLLDESLNPGGGTRDDRPGSFEEEMFTPDMPEGLQVVKPHEDRFEEAPPKRYRVLGNKGAPIGYGADPTLHNLKFTEDAIVSRRGYREGLWDVAVPGRSDLVVIYGIGHHHCEVEEIPNG